MLAIGRCLMGKPDLVMFDEPSLGLAPAVVQEVLQTIRDLNREGLTCVLVEQNVAVSLKLASRAYVLENGRVTLSGTGAELLADDRVRQAYLGNVIQRRRRASSARTRCASGESGKARRSSESISAVRAPSGWRASVRPELRVCHRLESRVSTRRGAEVFGLGAGVRAFIRITIGRS